MKRATDSPSGTETIKRLGRRSLLSALVALIALVMVPTAGHATTLLPPGGCIGSCAGSLGTVDAITFSGPILASTGVVSFTGTNALGQTKYTGQVQEIVVQDTGGLLDFVYQFKSLTGDPIGSLAVTDYTGFVTLVGTNAGNLITPPGGTVSPAVIDRNSLGGTLTFDFGPNIPSGVQNNTETFELVVKTNATAFGPGSLNFLDGGIASVVGFAPAGSSTVPEPTTVCLLGSGLIGLGLMRYLRSRAR